PWLVVFGRVLSCGRWSYPPPIMCYNRYRQGPGVARPRQCLHHTALRPAQDAARGQSDVPRQVLTGTSVGVVGIGTCCARATPAIIATAITQVANLRCFLTGF